MSHHGLTSQNLEAIKSILRPYATKIEKVALFGSRAVGTYRENSDIDMVIYGDLKESDIDRLYTLFDESTLPVKVDVNAYNLVDYPPLKAHIDTVMYPLLLQKDLLQTL